MTQSSSDISASIESRARALSVGPISALFKELGAKAGQLLGSHGDLSPSDRKAIELYFAARRQVAGAVEGVVQQSGAQAANDERFNPQNSTTSQNTELKQAA